VKTVLMEVGEDGGGCMRLCRPDEDVMTWARLMTTRPGAYWGKGQGHLLKRLDPATQQSLFSDDEGVDVLDAVAIGYEPAVWVKAEIGDDVTEVGPVGLNPKVTFEEGLP
jgi:hypothetical protein